MAFRRPSRNSPALKAYFVNLMSQPGETTNFRASDHVEAILRHCGKARNLIDVCVVNTGTLPGRLLNPYQAKSAQPVENDTGESGGAGSGGAFGRSLAHVAGQGWRKDPPRSGLHRRGDPGAGSAGTPQKTETEGMKTSVVILAAGLGTRMRSKQAKVLHRAGGLSLVEQWCWRRERSPHGIELWLSPAIRPIPSRRCSSPWAFALRARCSRKAPATR